MTDRPFEPFLRKWELRGALLGSNLSSSARLILMLLENHCDQDGVCWPARSTLAKASGLGETTVRLALLELKDRRLIRWVVGHQNQKQFRLLKGEILRLSALVNPTDSVGMDGQSDGFHRSIRRIPPVNPTESVGPIRREQEGKKEERWSSGDDRLTLDSSVSQLPLPDIRDRAAVEDYAGLHGWGSFWPRYPIKRHKQRALDFWVYEMNQGLRGLAVAGLGPWLEGRERSRAPDGFVDPMPGASVWCKDYRWEDVWEEAREPPAAVDAAAERLGLIEEEAARHSCSRRLSEYWKRVDRQAGPIEFEEVLNG